MDPVRKPVWRISEDQDWSAFQLAVKDKIISNTKDYESVNDLASQISKILLASGKETVGLKTFN